MKAWLLLVLAAATACNFKFNAFRSGLAGDGNLKSEARPPEVFTAVEATGSLELALSVGPGTPKLELRGDANLLPHVRTRFEGGVLRIDSDQELAPNHPLVVTAHTGKLDKVSLSGAGKVQVLGLHGDRFALNVSGAAHAKLAGDVSATSLDIAGAGKVDAAELVATDVEVQVSGAGKASVYATGKLKVGISGAGRVSYAGKPKAIEKSISGVGVLREQDDK
ncbi:MAG: DUF2807 domain-containing protein [Deltaproteobacteria bacterium]|nr:DUF2807 domain-containing protein [Deltaproteobacteria bacterium]